MQSSTVAQSSTCTRNPSRKGSTSAAATPGVTMSARTPAPVPPLSFHLLPFPPFPPPPLLSFPPSFPIHSSKFFALYVSRRPWTATMTARTRRQPEHTRRYSESYIIPAALLWSLWDSPTPAFLTVDSNTISGELWNDRLTNVACACAYLVFFRLWLFKSYRITALYINRTLIRFQRTTLRIFFRMYWLGSHHSSTTIYFSWQVNSDFNDARMYIVGTVTVRK